MAMTGGDILVSIFLRGACDGLNIVPPLNGEDRKLYEAARPNLAMPLTGKGAVLPLDDRFGLHPSASALHKLFQDKKLAIVHAAGLPSNSRSHFDAQALMEHGTPERPNTRTGWLTRVAQNVKGPAEAHLPSVAIGSLVPTSFEGEKTVAVINQLRQLNPGGPPRFQDAEIEALTRMYSGIDWLCQDGTRALRTLKVLRASEDVEYKPAAGVTYPNNELGNRLKVLAQLIALGVGVRIATVDMGGWDTHRYQGVGEDGRLASLVLQLSQAIEAFHLDMAGRPVTIVIMSEFGRRLKENANRGTDHGHGNIMLALGDHVAGGKVYGEWPGLKNENLYEHADLAVTTDYRQVLSEMLMQRQGLKARAVAGIFPGFTPKKALGLFARSPS